MDTIQNALIQNGQDANAIAAINMILVMGVTGAGKSFFINQLAGIEVVKEGAGLNSCTRKCQAVLLNIGGRKTLVIDTPGFDDTRLPAGEILAEISKTLTIQYQSGMKLKGAIYLHRISDGRYAGSAVQTFDIFREICGEDAFKNVLLVTNRWDEVTHRPGQAYLGPQREHELREEFWSHMLSRGSGLARFYGTRESAVALISQLVCKDPVVFALQYEINTLGKHLDKTSAGSRLDNRLTELNDIIRKEMQSLRKIVAELDQRQADLNQRQDVLDNVERVRRDKEANEVQKRVLRQDVAYEVRTNVEKEKSTWQKVLGFVPLVISLFGAIAGITVPFGEF